MQPNDRKAQLRFLIKHSHMERIIHSSKMSQMFDSAVNGTLEWKRNIAASAINRRALAERKSEKK